MDFADPVASTSYALCVYAVNAERRCPQFSDLICPLFIG